MKRLTFFTWQSPNQGYQRYHFGAVILGLTWALCATVAVVLAIGAFAMVKGGAVYYLANMIIIIASVSSLIGGLVSGAVINRQGSKHGLLVGGLYGVFFAILAIYLGIYSLSISLLLITLLLVVAGILGGIIGVNLPSKHSKKRRGIY